MNRPRQIDRSHRYEGPLPDPRAIPDDREPSRFHVALAILGCVIVALALFSAVL